MTRNAAEDPHPEDEIIRTRQRERARIMGLLLGAFIILLFLVTLAKIGTGQ